MIQQTQTPTSTPNPPSTTTTTTTSPSTLTLTNSQIKTLHNFLNLNPEIPLPHSKSQQKTQQKTQQQTSKQKLQAIFEHLCEQKDCVVPAVVREFGQYLRNGWIVLTGHKYRGVFEKFVFGRIRQPYPYERQFLSQNNQVKLDSIITQNKPTVQTNPKIQQPFLTLSNLLLQQQYNHHQISTQFQHLLPPQPHPNSPNPKSLWQLPTLLQTNPITTNQYYLHLLQYLLQSLTINNNNSSVYREVVVEGWLNQDSRWFFVEFLSCFGKFMEENREGEGEIGRWKKRWGEYVWRIIGAMEEVGDWSWEIFYGQFVEANEKFWQVKIDNILKNIKDKQDDSELIAIIDQLSPSLVYYLSSHPIYTQLYPQQPPSPPKTPTPNTNYLLYLHTHSSNPNHPNTNTMPTKYLTQQIHTITKELINNSYPTTKIIYDSYIAITNVWYEIERVRKVMEKEEMGEEMVKEWIGIVGKVGVEVGKCLIEVLGKDDVNEDEKEDYNRLLKKINRKQRLQAISKHLTQISTQSLNFNLNLTPTQILLFLNLSTSTPSPTKLPTTLLQSSTKSFPKNCLLSWLLIASYLAEQDYCTDYGQFVGEVLGKLLEFVEVGRVRGGVVVGKGLGVLWELGRKYGDGDGNGNGKGGNLWVMVLEGIKKVIDRIEEDEKILAYLSKNYGRQGDINIFYWGTTVADTALNFSLSHSPATNFSKQSPIIQQLLQQKSTLLQTCQTLLTTSPKSVLPYLTHLHNPSSPTSLSSHKIYNLHQLNNISIKYHEITQHNPEYKQPVSDSDFYRNHGNFYLYLECLKCYVDSQLGGKQGEGKGKEKEEIVGEICRYIVENLKEIKKIQYRIVHFSAEFYAILNVWRFIYAMVYYKQICDYLTADQQHCILQRLIDIAEAGSINPLVRQYISVIIAKLYMSLTHSSSSRQKWRQLLISKLNTDHQNININICVPIIFTLGYEMLQQTRTLSSPLSKTNPNPNLQLQQQLQQIFQIFIRYISCHHAYIRSIAQYYIKSKIQIEVENAKLMQGGGDDREEDNQSFLKYLCNNVWKYDKDCVKIMKNVGVSVQGFREAMGSEAKEFLGYQRVEEYPSQIVMNQLRYDLVKVLTKLSNSIQNKPLKQSLQNLLQKKLTQSLLPISPKTPLTLHYKPPQIIIIATLLQKVHNFGYILRTLHNKRAMLLVPSKQPLQHPQCQQFIPKNSQVEIVEIKEQELEKFVEVNKRLGYQMVGLEQCAGSVKIQQYRFPDRYMLLLGNQRIGAPASLLNMADVLVEIAQVGKVRSLNVHVSMAICVWQSIINNQNKTAK